MKWFHVIFSEDEDEEEDAISRRRRIRHEPEILSDGDEGENDAQMES